AVPARGPTPPLPAPSPDRRARRLSKDLDREPFMRLVIASPAMRARPSHGSRRVASRLAARALPLWLLATPTAALAQGPIHTPDDAIVVTASRATEDARAIGSAVSVITETDIARGQLTFVKDALQDVPGVTVSSDRPGDF